jgi:hypothetical protein
LDSLIFPGSVFGKGVTVKNQGLELYVITYNISDLPVWRHNGKAAPTFAPELLTKYLRATVDPDSWNAGAEVRPMADKATLVISQSQQNHDKIADAIDSIRDSDPREVKERLRTR